MGDHCITSSGSRGTSWIYHGQGVILFATDGTLPLWHQQSGLAKINAGDSVTVVVKDGQLSFAVNGIAQGNPIDLPPDTEVAMAVSIGRGQVRLSYTRGTLAC